MIFRFRRPPSAWFILPAALLAGLGCHCAWGQQVYQPRGDAAENRQVITFPAALALVAGQNPQIAFAKEQVNEAFAQLRGAKALWLPSIQAGVNYQNHQGPLQNSDGTVPVSNRSALEAGLGMYAVGGGAPAIPGVSAKFGVADAVFQPRVADEQVAARQAAATGATHDNLMFAAVAYLDLLRSCQQQAIAQETLNRAGQLARLTGEFARTGQGNQADADRAQTELSLRRNALALAAAQTQVASARLVELLNMPPGRTLSPAEPTIVPIELVSPEAGAAQLVADGLSHRPELAQSRHLVAAAAEQLDRERVCAAAAQRGGGCEPERLRRRAGRDDRRLPRAVRLRRHGLLATPQLRPGGNVGPRSGPFAIGTGALTWSSA